MSQTAPLPPRPPRFDTRLRNLFLAAAGGWTILTALAVWFLFATAAEAPPDGTRQLLQAAALAVLMIWCTTLALLIAAARRLRQRIAERDAFEAGLQQSERRYRELLEQSAAPIAVVSAAGIDYVNPAFCRMLGYTSADELLGRGPEVLIAPPDLDMVLARFTERLHGGNPPTGYEIRALKRDGQTIWAELTGRRIEYAGSPAVQVECSDVTARRLALEALGKSEARFRSLVEAMADGVWEVTPDGAFSYVSPRLCEMLGYSAEELLGRNSLELTISDPVLREAAVQRMRTAQLFHLFEHATHTRDGRPLVLEASGEPFFASDGSLQGYRGVSRDITARQAAQQALRLSEARFRGLVEGTSDLIFATDTEGRITYANPVAERTLGLSAEQLAGRSGWDFIHSGDLPAARDYIAAQAAAGAGQFTLECRILDRQGRERHLLWRADYQAAGAGHAAQVSIIAHDMTERRRAEEAQRLNEARLEALQRLNHMAGVDERELCRFALEAGIDLTRSTLGYLAFLSDDGQRLRMHTWSAGAMDPAQVPPGAEEMPLAAAGVLAEPALVRRAVVANAPAPHPATGGPPAGHAPIQRYLNVPVFDGERVVATAGVANKADDYDELDVRQLSLLMQGMWGILQQRRAEARLAEREARLAALVDSFDGGLYIVSPALRLEYVNEQLAQQLGRDPVGETCHQALYGMLTPCPWCQLGTDGAGQALHREVELPGGLWRDMSFTPVRGAGAGDSLVSLQDITERKQAEAALQKQQHEESIALLAGGIAHDFNNILLGVLGSASLLEDSLPLHTESRELCETISTSARRMSALTDKLLSYARGGRYQPQPVDAGEAMRDALAMLKGSQPPQVQVDAEIEAGLWLVLADPGQLHQVFLNIVLNAFEALAPTGGVLRISMRNTVREAWYCQHGRRHAAGEYICASISDNGPGMDEATLRRAFEPYFSTKAAGRGLGLAAVYGIVRHHGGCLEVESVPGRGTVFNICFPRCLAQLQRTAAALPPGGGRETVLVVDDEPTVLTVARKSLSKAGYTVLSAPDGLAGLELARAQDEPVALAVLDQQMPGLSGLELAVRLRADGLAERVLLSSGYSELAAEDSAPRGIDGFLHKPYTAHDLLSAVRAALDTPPRDMDALS